MAKKLAVLCLILGGLLIGASLSLVIYNIWESYTSDKAAQETAVILEEEIEKNKEEDIKVPEEQPVHERFPNMDMPIVMINGYAYIGLLEVPSIHLVLPVMEEWDYERLKISPCRYVGSAYTNDLVIAGHNYYRHFTPIKSLPIGAEITFTDVKGNRFEYEIVATEILEPSQSDILISETEEETWDLTLFTCTTGGATRHVVRCERLEQ